MKKIVFRNKTEWESALSTNVKTSLGIIVKRKKARCRIKSDTSYVRKNKNCIHICLCLHKEIPEYT